MSCEEDDDMWDPVIDVVEENKLIEVPIDAVSKGDLEMLYTQLVTALDNKLKKLNILLKNLNVYCLDNVLLVNDRYGICKEFEDIARAFGFTVETADCGVKGKSYILYDRLIGLIRMLNPDYSIDGYANKKADGVINIALKKYGDNLSITNELQSVLQIIMREGKYTVAGSQKVVTTFEDGRQVSQEVGKIISNAAEITAQLREYMSTASERLSSANKNLQEGTVKLLHLRARQMGYSVNEERKGTQVQLVLVRNE